MIGLRRDRIKEAAGNITLEESTDTEIIDRLSFLFVALVSAMNGKGGPKKPPFPFNHFFPVG